MTQTLKSVLKNFKKQGCCVETFPENTNKNLAVFLNGSFYINSRKLLIETGINNIDSEIKHYLKEDDINCFVSEFSRDSINYKITFFTDTLSINGKSVEAAYLRIVNTTSADEAKNLPLASKLLIPLVQAKDLVKPGETVTRDYVFPITKDKSVSVMQIILEGSFDERYEHIKHRKLYGNCK